MTRYLFLFGLLNGVLYSLLTPLWEGFDEPYHYAVVQQMARRHRWPQYGRDGISPEVARSLELLPAAPAVSANHGGRLITFGQWFALSLEERESRRRQVRALDPALALGPEEGRNYESQQAPLAYLVMAPLDWALSGAPLQERIAALRVFAVVVSVLLLGWSVLYAARGAGMNDARRAWTLFCLFQAQMLYAASAHIANDGLAIALGGWLLAAIVGYHHGPSTRTAAFTGLAMASLIMTKAYGLAFLPAVLWILRRHTIAFAVPVVAVAGPWYARNLLLYGELSGAFTFTDSTLTTVSGFFAMPWLETLLRQGRFFLFTGNNHFLSFNQSTIHAGLVLLAAAVGWSAWTRRDGFTINWLLLMVSFTLGWAYSLYQAFLYTGQQAVPLSPWYGQILLAPLLLAAARGAPRWLLGLLAAFFTYLMAGTWWLKLLPLYGGYRGERATVSALAKWYSSSDWAALSQTALAPAGLLFSLAALSTLAGLAGCTAGWARRGNS